MNKRKIINDPVYGFINIPSELIYDIIEHRYFQRLRRIKQLGLSDLVYPGALHTRFHHALGAMHLMGRALHTLRQKQIEITNEEYEATLIAILLHDIGHGPFSHTLEFSLFPNTHHEEISLNMMKKINAEMNGALGLAITIFGNKYERPFLHQLVSSQLDIDRLDYLKRDSFFTGVYEGMISSERIIKMLNVVNENLVVEEKGIYSIENFLSARRLMYWQVYHHKVSTSAEVMLLEIIKQAKKLVKQGQNIFSTPALQFFLTDLSEKNQSEIIEQYALLDDTDIWASLKFWQNNDDFTLSKLSTNLLNRKLHKAEIINEKISKELKTDLIEKTTKLYNISQKQAKSFVKTGKLTNAAYITTNQSIFILKKSGEVLDVADATDLPNIKAMSKIVKKYFICAPKDVFKNNG